MLDKVIKLIVWSVVESFLINPKCKEKVLIKIKQRIN